MKHKFIIGIILLSLGNFVNVYSQNGIYQTDKVFKGNLQSKNMKEIEIKAEVVITNHKIYIVFFGDKKSELNFDVKEITFADEKNSQGNLKITASSSEDDYLFWYVNNDNNKKLTMFIPDKSGEYLVFTLL